MTGRSRAHPELLFGLAALGAAVVVIILVVLSNMSMVERAIGRDRKAHEVLAQADAAMAAMVDQETGLRGYVISANVTFLDPYDAGRRNLKTALARLADLNAGDAEQSRRVAEIARLADVWTQTFAAREIAEVEAGQVTKAQSTVTAGAGKQRMTLSAPP